MLINNNILEIEIAPRQAQGTSPSLYEVEVCGYGESVTDNFFAVAQKFPRPRLAAEPAGSAFAPSFSSPFRQQIKKTGKLQSFLSVRVRGIEPRSQPWEGRILPLNYARFIYILA